PNNETEPHELRKSALSRQSRRCFGNPRHKFRQPRARISGSAADCLPHFVPARSRSQEETAMERPSVAAGLPLFSAWGENALHSLHGSRGISGGAAAVLPRGQRRPAEVFDFVTVLTSA